MGGPRYHNQPITAADRQDDHRRGVPADPRRPADGFVRPADFAGQDCVPVGHLAARHPAGCGRYPAGSADQDSGSVRLAGCPFDCLDSDLPFEDPLSRRSGTSSKTHDIMWPFPMPTSHQRICWAVERCSFARRSPNPAKPFMPGKAALAPRRALPPSALAPL